MRKRTLTPAIGEVAPRPNADPTSWAYRCALLGVVLTFLLPSGMLVAFGVYSEDPGGNPLTKFHPATYVFIVAAWLALYDRRGTGMTELFRSRPLLALSIVLIVACTVYSILVWGASGAALYIETFLSAALAAVALESGTDKQLRQLAQLILAFCLIAVCMSVLEGSRGLEFFPQAPLHLSAAQVKVLQQFDGQASEFRGPAFYEHPLTGALVTSMAFFLAMSMRLRWWFAASVFGWLFVGLMSFGGRAALGTTVLMITSAALFQLASGLAKRELSLGLLAAFVAGSILLPVLTVVLVTETNIGARIVGHLYEDDSAEVRFIQWHILPLLDFHEVLFGLSADRFETLKTQVGLAGLDVENPWLLTFFGLGLIGWPLLLGGMLSLMLHLGRRANNGASWMLVTTVLLICSTFNSVGRKTPILVFVSLFAVAMSGFRARREQASPEPDGSDTLEHSGHVAYRARSLTAVAQSPHERGLRMGERA
jgi:hypothetical protein